MIVESFKVGQIEVCAEVLDGCQGSTKRRLNSFRRVVRGFRIIIQFLPIEWFWGDAGIITWWMDGRRDARCAGDQLFSLSTPFRTRPRLLLIWFYFSGDSFPFYSADVSLQCMLYINQNHLQGLFFPVVNGGRPGCPDRNVKRVGQASLHFVTFRLLCGRADKTGWIGFWLMCVQCVNYIKDHL